MAVGCTTCSLDDIKTSGPQGKKITIYHCFKDYLWYEKAFYKYTPIEWDCQGDQKKLGAVSKL